MVDVREKAITRTSIIGILSNLLLVCFKAAVGFLSGSIAIILDAVNNLTDALSSVITIAGIKLAKRVPDEKHPYGHGRIEYFSTILISFIILFAGVSSIIESIKKIIHPTMAHYTAVTILVIVVSVVVKLLLGRYVKGQGKKYNSDALVASGADASFDAIISVATLVGAAVTLMFHISIDGIIGAGISVFIIKAGMEMLLEAVGNVMGSRPDSVVTAEIKKTVAGIPGVLGAYDLILHDYGPESAIGSVHIEIPATMTATEIHELEKKIQIAVHKKFKIFMTVGIYAVEMDDVEIVSMRETIKDMCCSNEGVLNAHGFYIDMREQYMSFDVMTDFTVPDRKKLVERILSEIDTMYPGFKVEVNLDINYSD